MTKRTVFLLAVAPVSPSLPLTYFQNYKSLSSFYRFPWNKLGCFRWELYLKSMLNATSVNFSVFSVWITLSSSLYIYVQCELRKCLTMGSGSLVLWVVMKNSLDLNSWLWNFYPQVTWESLQACCFWSIWQDYAFTLCQGGLGSFVFFGLLCFTFCPAWQFTLGARCLGFCYD